MEKELVQEFHEAYVKANPQKLSKLWEEKAPKSLIKFYTGKYECEGINYLLNSLSNNTIWLASPRFFNDPFDCVINVDYYCEAEQISRKILEKRFGTELTNILMSLPNTKDMIFPVVKYLKNENEGKHMYEEKSIYVSCFSELENLQSLRMWANYANNHSGVCIEYDFDAVNNVSPFACIPISYSDDYTYLLNTKDVSENVSNFLKFFTKAQEWEYEKEWRVAIKSEKINQNGCIATIATPIAVYLGCKVSEKLEKDVVSICKERNINLYKMKMRPGSFKLDVAAV